MKNYIVTAKPRFPENDRGATFEYTTKNKAEAIKKAREFVRREYIYDRFNGGISYSAVEY